MKTSTAAEKTDRPELWRLTYWGACRDLELVSADIIGNRNDFALAWNLRAPARITLPPFSRFGRGFEIDHLELYRDTSGAVIALCSNYGATPPPAALGMIETAPLYVRGARSYAVRFTTIRALRAAFRAVAGHTPRAGT